MKPTVLISIARIVAAIGVPKSAEKEALMPHMMRIGLSSFGKRKRRPSALPIEPPT